MLRMLVKLLKQPQIIPAHFNIRVIQLLKSYDVPIPFYARTSVRLQNWHRVAVAHLF
jgi:hypothetical protein